MKERYETHAGARHTWPERRASGGLETDRRTMTAKGKRSIAARIGFAAVEAPRFLRRRIKTFMLSRDAASAASGKHKPFYRMTQTLPCSRGAVQRFDVQGASGVRNERASGRWNWSTFGGRFCYLRGLQRCCVCAIRCACAFTCSRKLLSICRDIGCAIGSFRTLLRGPCPLRGFADRIPHQYWLIYVAKFDASA